MSAEHIEFFRLLWFMGAIYSACMMFGILLTAVTSNIFDRMERKRNAK